ncbi:testis-specific serine kinase substrate isoform X9 [Prionailurus iriomotensis]
MASVVVKTIWQSKEIHEAGDPPAGVESHSELVPEAPEGVSTPAKGITKKKKAVSFHGVEPRMSHKPMHWCLNLKRSSACTNVSLLNLAATEPTDSSGTDSTTEDSGPLALPVPPASPTLPWASDDPDISEILVLNAYDVPGAGVGAANGQPDSVLDAATPASRGGHDKEVEPVL